VAPIIEKLDRPELEHSVPFDEDADDSEGEDDIFDPGEFVEEDEEIHRVHLPDGDGTIRFERPPIPGRGGPDRTSENRPPAGPECPWSGMG
jgi:hypothetical protein